MRASNTDRFTENSIVCWLSASFDVRSQFANHDINTTKEHFQSQLLLDRNSRFSEKMVGPTGLEPVTKAL